MKYFKNVSEPHLLVSSLSYTQLGLYTLPRLPHGKAEQSNGPDLCWAWHILRLTVSLLLWLGFLGLVSSSWLCTSNLKGGRDFFPPGLSSQDPVT